MNGLDIFTDPEADMRLVMRWEVPYEWPVPLPYCSAGGSHSPDQVPMYVTKHHHPRQPKGHLYTRCAAHQLQHDQGVR